MRLVGERPKQLSSEDEADDRHQQWAQNGAGKATAVPWDTGVPWLLIAR